jgi:nucleoside-diphosphate-sugar epimerase
MNLDQNKITVFGGTGFIGNVFCNLYSDDVLLIPRDNREPLTKNILYFISTTSNKNMFSDLFIDIDTNLKVLMEVLQNCKNKNITFNFVSSCFVYGNDVLGAKETDCCNPYGFYSITKRCAEQLLITFCKSFDVKYRILRVGNVYGMDRSFSYKKYALGYILNQLKTNQSVTLYGGGNFLKDYIHVDDVCRAIKLILDCGNYNEIYNIGSGNPKLFSSIIDESKNNLKSDSLIIKEEFPKDKDHYQTKNMTLNIDKLKDLGFVPSVNFSDGLSKFCNELNNML